MYPRTGTTKGEVLNYYAQVAPVMLPHLADRAVTRIRWPNGTSEQSFFEKNVPGGTPSWVRTVDGADHRLAHQVRRGGRADLPGHRLAADADLAGQPRRPRAARAPVDGHASRASRATPTGWSSTSTPVSRPAWGSAAQVALLVKERLEQDGLDCVPVTSGSKGLHLYAGLDRKRTYEEVRDYAKGIAEELAGRAPQAGALADDQGPAQREGVPRLVAEHRREDDDLAVLPARAGAARRSRPPAPGTRSRPAPTTRWPWSRCGSAKSRIVTTTLAT